MATKKSVRRTAWGLRGPTMRPRSRKSDMRQHSATSDVTPMVSDSDAVIRCGMIREAVFYDRA